MSPTRPAETTLDDAMKPLARLAAVLAVRSRGVAAPQTAESLLKPFHSG
jgi:hypothetical protein